MPEGALLLLFTDGLVEGRAQPVEAGLLALRNAVAELGALEPAGLEEVCDTLLRVMGRDGRPDDDSALLAVLTGGREAEEAGAHLHLAGHLSEVARARRLAVEWADRTGCDRDDAALLVTEVATNALRHGGPGVDLWVRPGGDDGLRVELIDGRADAVPRVRERPSTTRAGAACCSSRRSPASWGTERLSAGKCVWFELAPAALTSSRRRAGSLEPRQELPQHRATGTSASSWHSTPTMPSQTRWVNRCSAGRSSFSATPNSGLRGSLTRANSPRSQSRVKRKRS